MPNKLSQFWQELKKRNVVSMVMIYTWLAVTMLLMLASCEEKPQDNEKDIYPGRSICIVLVMLRPMKLVSILGV